MPANLTPVYEQAEQRYKAAATDDEKLDALREMFATIPKHKGTEKLQAEIKRKISRIRKAVSRAPQKAQDLFHIPRAGAGQVVLVGTPNVGKSAIVQKTTGAHVKVTEFPFATTVPAPGMCHFEQVQIELVDTPPVTADHIPSGLLGTIRSADIVAIVVDATAEALDEAEAALGVLRGRGLILRTVLISELDPSDPADHCAMLVVNKVDIGEAGVVETLRELYGPELEVFGVSAQTGEGMDKWIARIWELLASIRVFTKEPGEPAEMTKPYTLPIGSTVEDLAHEIHRDLPAKMKFARIWGEGRHSGMQVHRTEELKDRDVVEIHE